MQKRVLRAQGVRSVPPPPLPAVSAAAGCWLSCRRPGIVALVKAAHSGGCASRFCPASVGAQHRRRLDGLRPLRARERRPKRFASYDDQTRQWRDFPETVVMAGLGALIVQKASYLLCWVFGPVLRERSAPSAVSSPHRGDDRGSSLAWPAAATPGWQPGCGPGVHASGSKQAGAGSNLRLAASLGSALRIC